MDGIEPPELNLFVLGMYAVILFSIVVVGYGLVVKLRAVGVLIIIGGLALLIYGMRWLNENPGHWIVDVMDTVLLWFLTFTRIVE